MEMEVHDRCRCVLRTERKAKAEARTRVRTSATIMEIGAVVAEAGRIVVCPRRVVGLWVNATVVATGAIIRVNAGNLSNLSQSSTMMKFHQFQLETAQSLLLYHWCCRRVNQSRSSFIDHAVNAIFKILHIIHGHQQLHQRTPQEFAPNSKLVLGSTLKQ